ncbi:hypothetical protein WMF27_31815 [Sorangium sp. So ce281]|uniref:hypothetical protein n=1 Tax=unclassified Sorangium TaxID=2621164 RepID=UPI003F5F4748
MTRRVDLYPTEVWPLAAKLADDPASWAVLAVGLERVDIEVADAVETLASLIDEPVEPVRVTSPSELLKAVREHAQSALVLHGFDALSPEAWRRIDANRSRLQRTLPALLVLGQPAVERMRVHAPNLWSWVASAAWRGVPEEGLSDEQRAQRLGALRAHFGFDDDELVRRAEAGTVPPEPDITEWLVLIGRGDLIRR